MVTEIKKHLKSLGFNSNEIKVYIALTQLGEAKAAEIAKKADIPRTTAISILEKLREENYLTCHQYRGVTFYWIESPKVIANIFDYKINVANHLSDLLADLYRTEAHFPLSQVYDTKSGIKKFIERILSNVEKKSVIYTIDTPGAGNYAKIFSDTTEKSLAAIKKMRAITTHTLVPFGAFKNITPKKVTEQNIIIREMPEKIKFEASMWIIKDTLTHFSGKPPFVVTIKHDVIVSGIKSIYDFLWSVSEEKG